MLTSLERQSLLPGHEEQVSPKVPRKAIAVTLAALGGIVMLGTSIGVTCTQREEKYKISCALIVIALIGVVLVTMIYCLCRKK